VLKTIFQFLSGFSFHYEVPELGAINQIFQFLSGFSGI